MPPIMICEPRPNRKTAAAVTLACLTSALALVGVSLAIQNVFSDIMKITALALFLGAVTVISRYLAFNFVYVADENEFAVYRKTNKGKLPLCRLFYTELTTLVTPTEAKKTEGILRRYDYRMTLGTKKYYCLFFDSSEGREVIFLECDSGFAEYLKQRISPDPLAQYLSDNLDKEF